MFVGVIIFWSNSNRFFGHIDSVKITSLQYNLANNDYVPNSYETSFTWILTLSLSLSFLSCFTNSRNFGVRRMNAFTMWPRSWKKIRLVYKLLQEHEASKIGWVSFKTGWVWSNSSVTLQWRQRTGSFPTRELFAIFINTNQICALCFIQL